MWSLGTAFPLVLGRNNRFFFILFLDASNAGGRTLSRFCCISLPLSPASWFATHTNFDALTCDSFSEFRTLHHAWEFLSRINHKDITEDFGRHLVCAWKAGGTGR